MDQLLIYVGHAALGTICYELKTTEQNNVSVRRDIVAMHINSKLFFV